MRSLIILCVIVLVGCGEDRVTIKNVKGVAGPAGRDGSNGVNSLVKIYRTDSIDSLICVDGSGLAVESGLDINQSNVLDASEVQALNFVCDGEVGPAGADGAIGAQGPQGEQAPNAIVEVIDPCGDAPGIYDEVLLKLDNGLILASFSDNASGLNTRFSLIGDGSYQTTDASNCHFSISAGVVSW